MTDTMIERAARLAPSLGMDEEDAIELLNAALPVVDTAEALDALPNGATVMATDGALFRKDGRWFLLDLDMNGSWLLTLHLAEQVPLRVVWTPEGGAA